VEYGVGAYVIAYGIAAIVFFALSFLWIGFIVWSAKVWWNRLGKKKTNTYTPPRPPGQ